MRYYADDWLTVYLGDCRQVMATMEPESVHCVVTSPPYWGLRDYGTEGQLGLEPTPKQYVENMVAVFREVRRVLRSDGAVWLNLGDSYSGGGSGPQGESGEMLHRQVTRNRNLEHKRDRLAGLKPKDLVGIPWRVAFALQADGWYLRSDIIWSKPNPMPESVTDRPTKSHEYLFLLSKSPRYYFDNEAVREGAATGVWPGIGPKHDTTDNHKSDYEPMVVNAGRNIRSVWTIATQPYPGAHFATFPQALVEPCIKAGTSERGVCPACGAPWERVVERTAYDREDAGQTKGMLVGARRNDGGRNLGGTQRAKFLAEHPARELGWRPGCPCVKESAGWVSVPATVLDPFAGSGTVGLVAQRLSRRAVLIDLNADYLGQVMDRNRDMPLGLGA